MHFKHYQGRLFVSMKHHPKKKKKMTESSQEMKVEGGMMNPNLIRSLEKMRIGKPKNNIRLII